MINTQSLYDSVSRAFGVLGTSKAFVASFFNALHIISSDIAVRAFVEFDAPTELETNIDLDGKYYGVIYHGLVNEINNGPEWNITPKGDTGKSYERALGLAQCMYYADNPTNTYFSDDELE